MGNSPETALAIHDAGMVYAFPQSSGTVVFSVYVLCIAEGTPCIIICKEIHLPAALPEDAYDWS